MTEVKATPLEIIHADEPIMEIRLSNSYTARVRLIVTSAWQMDGKTDPFGNPEMHLTWQVASSIIPTRKLSN